MLCRLVVGEIVEEDGAQNGAFGFDVCRKRLRGNVISGRHLNFFVVVFQESFRPTRNRYYSQFICGWRASDLENESETLFFRWTFFKAHVLRRFLSSLELVSLTEIRSSSSLGEKMANINSSREPGEMKANFRRGDQKIMRSGPATQTAFACVNSFCRRPRSAVQLNRRCHQRPFQFDCDLRRRLRTRKRSCTESRVAGL